MSTQQTAHAEETGHKAAISDLVREGLLIRLKEANADVLSKEILVEPYQQDTGSNGKSKEESFSVERSISPPIVWLEAVKADEEKAISLQKWEGVVTNVLENTFIARLYDQTAENPEEEAELLISDISDDDRDLLMPGAVFYWSIGYRVSRSGQKKRESFIKFRRLPAWTENELNKIRQRAIDKMNALGWESDERLTSSR